MQQEPALYRRNDKVLFSEIGADVVALSVERGECFGMEDVAADVWRMLESPASLSSICTELQRSYEVDQDRCVQETRALIDEMLAKGLILPAAVHE